MNSTSIKYSILDLASVVEGDTYKETFNKSVKSAQFAEDLGYERYWFSEHHNMPSVISASTSLLIGHVAQQTKKIRVGSGGIMLPNHTTLSIAEQFGTLEAMFPGRIDLGLGRAPGTDPLTASVLRRGDQNLNYNFEFHIQELFRYFSFDNENSKVRAFPGEGANVPIYILGSSTDSAFLAAKLGLPYAFAGHFAPGQFQQAFEIYQSRFTPSQYLDKPYSMLCLSVFAAETEDEAVYHSLPQFQAIVNLLTDNRKPLCSPEYTNLENLSPELQAGVHRMTALSMIGNKEILKEKIGRIVTDLNLDEIMVYTNMFDFEAKLNSLKITAEVFQELNSST
ncbi:LLM class flavin-dependent oxidoreductase [Moheibacter lacus]|uniref:Luciferase-like monooxygenase n=1 Tax=Moheibacter lacus TaxID=2745851 RepID=A0A838ZT04_9FLAO|nr:LLM class flavin-dependent oxidoreductase [Moheibacter lacus]MBA5630114.1 LLM class flavin-dependent oxidoreductase [Moheibacter lacus]